MHNVMGSDRSSAQAEQDGGGMGQIIGGVIWLAILILAIAGLWKTFEKAGEPGWGAIVPLYNIYLMCKIAGRPGWWFILWLIPCVGVIIAIMVCLESPGTSAKAPSSGSAWRFWGSFSSRSSGSAMRDTLATRHRRPSEVDRRAGTSDFSCVSRPTYFKLMRRRG